MSLLGPFLLAQPADRITRPIDDRVTVTLPGNRHPLARPEFDRGPVAPDEPIGRMILVFSRDPNPQAELDLVTTEQQDPSSPLFHQWISPEEYGRRFGISEGDWNRIAAWLGAQGFQVEEIPQGRSTAVFSGTAGQVAAAFHTEIHRYFVNGEMHHANSSDPQIPAALSGVVAGIASLHDFRSHPGQTAAHPAPAPDFTAGAHYMTPADFATIYDVNPLYSANIDGTGTSIAVVARSNLHLTDVQAFRSMMGLTANSPTVILNGPDPGIVSADDQSEATFDVEWAGAIAGKAAVKFVVSASTLASDGVLLSAQYIVNGNVAPVMTTSFSVCEAEAGAAYAQFFNNLWQQAEAEGITPLVASGDSGAAGCDSPSQTTSYSGQSVNVICSTPYSTCVGGTQFNDATNPGIYWSANNNPTTLVSALGYIPEIVWNSSGTVPGGSDLWASGGGASIFFTKPSWQAANGVPADKWRHVPDVSFSASSHDGYLMYMNGLLYVVGGTSVSSPTWAGLMALVNQQSASIQGNANPALYALYRRQTSGGAAAFHAITSGNNSVPGTAGYSAGGGYNQATGLGSADAFALVQHWKDANTPEPLALSVSSSSLRVNAGSTAQIAATTTVGAGFDSAVTLSVIGLPSGLGANWSLSALRAPGAGSSTLTFSAARNLPATSYSLSLTASGAGVTETIPITVTVKALPEAKARR
ncbi:MAG TPA: S53 family peptidase [Bryobacteraceae bacterium]